MITKKKIVKLIEEHVADSDLFLVELMCSIQWANPFIWMLRKSIKETHEYLADRAVLNHGIQVHDYQKLLLIFFRTVEVALALFESQLKQAI